MGLQAEANIKLGATKLHPGRWKRHGLIVGSDVGQPGGAMRMGVESRGLPLDPGEHCCGGPSDHWWTNNTVWEMRDGVGQVGMQPLASRAFPPQCVPCPFPFAKVASAAAASATTRPSEGRSSRRFTVRLQLANCMPRPKRQLRQRWTFFDHQIVTSIARFSSSNRVATAHSEAQPWETLQSAVAAQFIPAFASTET